MSTEKKSFLLYCDIITTVAKLSDEQAGKLFKIILEYVNGNNPVIEDQLLDIAFDPIKRGLIRNAEKYENICKRNTNNGVKGGRPKTQRNPKKPKKPSGLLINQDEPKKTDSVIDSVNDNVIVNDSIYSFEQFWNDYQSKGNKKQSKLLYEKIPDETRQKIKDHVKKYVLSTLDKKFRKDAERYLRNECWNDEIVIQNQNPSYSKEQTGRILSVGKLPTEPGSYLPENFNQK